MPSLEALAQEIADIAAAPLGTRIENPLPTLDWPGPNKPKSWWGRGPDGQLTKVYRDYRAYCD